MLAFMLLGRAIVTSLAASPRASRSRPPSSIGWIVLALFVHGHGSRDVLGVTLLTLYVVPAFAFGWGWRWELGLELATALPAGALLASFAPSVRPAELTVAFALGSAIAIGVAEGTARNLRATHHHRLAAEARMHASSSRRATPTRPRRERGGP